MRVVSMCGRDIAIGGGRVSDGRNSHFIQDVEVRDRFASNCH